MIAPFAEDLVTDEDLLIGYVGGLVAGAPALPTTTLSPVQALREAIRPALERPPCVIGFSGGRDSSLLLAVAVDLARRDGLAPPIAVTAEFESERTHERDWQELVLSHLGVQDWVRLAQGDRLDLVGPIAAAGLHSRGVRYPANALIVGQLASVAEGGSVITGLGGDEVLGFWPFQTLAAVLARRHPVRRGHLRAAYVCALPARARTRRYIRLQSWVSLPWLRQPERDHAARVMATDVAGTPRTWTARMQWLGQRRIWPVIERSFGEWAADHGAATLAPLLDPTFLAALARSGGRLGIGDRTELMGVLAGDLLPEAVLARRQKAEFSEAYFGPYTKRFATEWDGRSGIDPELIDADTLRTEWLKDHPHGMSAALLQSAWLAQSRATARESTPQPPGVLDVRD